MKVGQLAGAAGVTVQAIRFYERRGLLPPPHRLPSGYREYSPAMVQTVRLIKQMQGLGFTLRELAYFVQLLESQPHNPSERRKCVEAKLKSIEQRIEQLKAMHAELSSRLLTCECCNSSTPVAL